jgi:hypothetical protein
VTADTLAPAPEQPRAPAPAKPGAARVYGIVELRFAIRWAYGHPIADPRNETARAFARACGTATLTPQALRYARAMGCRLVEATGRPDYLRAMLATPRRRHALALAAHDLED